jgi:hypothetical protein
MPHKEAEEEKSLLSAESVIENSETFIDSL